MPRVSSATNSRLAVFIFRSALERFPALTVCQLLSLAGPASFAVCNLNGPVKFFHTIQRLPSS